MRLLGKMIATLMVLLFLGVTIFATLLHTRYATTVGLAALNLFSQSQVSATAIDYHLSTPWQLHLQQPSLQRKGLPPLQAKQLSLWLSPDSLLGNGWVFDSLLIESPGPIKLNQQLTRLPAIKVHRLALTGIDLQQDELRVTDGELQIDNWHYDPLSHQPFWQQFSGDFQLSANTAQWRSFNVDNVLLDGHQQNQLWMLNGFSMTWQQADLSGQLEYHTETQQLLLQQLTLSDLQLQNSAIPDSLQAALESLIQSGIQITIARLDVLDSSVELPAFTLNHANLSLQNWHWPLTFWQQQKAHLSFNATDGNWHETAFIEPLAELYFEPQQITVQGASLALLEGYLRTSGTVTPEAILLDSLTANGIKWLLPENWQQSLAVLFNPVKTLSLSNLDIGYLQLIAVDDNTPWQVSGLNLKGHDLILMRESQWGLWQGELTTSASVASLNTVSMVEPLVEMSAAQGQWQMTRAIIPFQDGIMEASGRWERNTGGQPWSLDIDGDSLPAEIISQWFGIAFPLKGKLDITANFNGLGQSTTALAYSLDGRLDGSFRDIELTTPASALWQFWVGTHQPLLDTLETNSTQAAKDAPLTITPLALNIDRGRIQLSPTKMKGAEISAQLDGKWDLATSEDQQLKLKAWLGCQALSKVWQGNNQQTVSHSSCDGNSI
ncbi:AsmA family protein [Photobacterium minamisatsumaniensis]|uniref:AsmA family protein n=1 Tax=Photobacterium minamisatsumaniensis TaxID=2910233 RepID=UPI003D095D7E